MQMNNPAKSENDYYAVDLIHILKIIWHKAWLIVLAAILTAGIGFSISAFCIEPKYSSEIMLYVNNSSFQVGSTSFSFSSSELSAAQSLVKTYIVILNNRTTLEKVIANAGVSYTYEELSGMIEAASVNNTEVMSVKVTAANPYVAAKIANSIAEVLPIRISEIIEGSSMEVVDSGVVNLKKVSPNITKYTAVGFFIGLMLMIAALTLSAVLDGTIHDEDYIIQTYDYPILAIVPDLLDSGSKKYGYYYSRKR